MERKCRAWPTGQCSPRDPGCRTKRPGALRRENRPGRCHPGSQCCTRTRGAGKPLLPKAYCSERGRLVRAIWVCGSVCTSVCESLEARTPRAEKGVNVPLPPRAPAPADGSLWTPPVFRGISATPESKWQGPFRGSGFRSEGGRQPACGMLGDLRAEASVGLGRQQPVQRAESLFLLEKHAQHPPG